MGGYKLEGRCTGADNTEGEWRGLRWSGVHSRPLLSCLREMNMVICHTKKAWTIREPVLPCRKKKSNCGDVRLHKEARKLFARPQTDVQDPKTTTAGLLNQLNGIALSNVACTYILANLGAEVVFHLGVTTVYALTDLVVY